MIFPKPFVSVGECIAVIRRNGIPLIYLDNKIRPSTRYDGIRWKSHRLSYHLNCEKIPKTPENFPEGLILHTCDHGWCINPNHLYLGNQKYNIADIWERHPTIRETRRLQKLGTKQSDEIKRKISDSRKGVKRPDLIGNQLRRGIPHTEEMKKHIGIKSKESWIKRKEIKNA